MFQAKRWRPCSSCILFLALAIGLLASSPIQAGPVSTSVVSFAGTVDSILVNLGPSGGIQPTGPISISLDTSKANIFGLNDVTKQGVIDVTLVLNSPLFSALGESPTVRIQESGSAGLTGAGVPGDFDFLFTALLTGGGTINTGLFAGTVFHNLNIYEGEGLLGSWIPKPGSTVTWNIGNNGSVTFPDGSVVSGIGGSGTLVIGSVVPEPSSLTLAGLGIAAILALGRRRIWR